MALALQRSKPDSISFLEPFKHESTLEKCSDEPKTLSSGEQKYLPQPSVYMNPQITEDEDEPRRSDGFKNIAENIVRHEMTKKIQKSLDLLRLRDTSILIQFWSHCCVGKSKLLKTEDQPFGLGIQDERLRNYRRESESNRFRVDEECKEDDRFPVVRVFRRQLPEWTSDVANYNSENHPLRDCAIRLNLHGYLVLPVFDSLSMLCVGVLEFITCSIYHDYAYEVQEVHRTLKAENLTSPQAFDCPTSYVDRGIRNIQHEQDEIFKILKDCCITHKLPLAQTWKVSATNSFVATKENIETACNSFNSSCVGEVCMSTNGLPFYVHDLRFWPFRQACREQHSLKSKSVVGRALSSHGSCFCQDVTKLGEDEYSLVHNARMIGLTSCLAIYLYSKEHDDGYVLEFYLPVDMKEIADLQNLVQKLKLFVQCSSFEFGDMLNTEVIARPMEVSQQSLVLEHHIIQTALSKDSQIVAETIAQNERVMAQDQRDFDQVSSKNRNSSINNTEQTYVDDLTSKKNDIVTVDNETYTKESRKQKTDSITSSEHIENFSAKSIDEPSMSLKSMSLQLHSNDSQTIQKPNAQNDFTNAQDQQNFSNNFSNNPCSAIITNTVGVYVTDATSKNIDLVTGEKGACTKQSRKRKSESVTKENIKQYFGKPMQEASRSLGVSRSTLKRVCRKFNIPSWPTPDRNKKRNHFSISGAVFLLVRVKRWSCSSNHHGFSAKWWICGKHNSFVSRPNPSHKSDMIRALLSSSHISDTFDHVVEVLDDCRMVTVKATYNNDMIKFRIPVSSGLLELKNHVAQRFKLHNTRLHLKYKDEDDDLILIACDADFHNLTSFCDTSVSNNTIKPVSNNHTIKLVVQIAKN